MEIFKTILSQEQEFISLLMDNTSEPAAVTLLSVVSRQDPPVMELVEECNLNIILKNCYGQLGILGRIFRTQRFLETSITSGKVWEICKAGCSMVDVGRTGYAEGLIIHLLTSGDSKIKENASLAVSFLVKHRDFKLLYKFLAHYQAITTIITLLERNPLEEKVLASVVRLISIFKENHSNNYDKQGCFFKMEKKEKKIKCYIT